MTSSRSVTTALDHLGYTGVAQRFRTAFTVQG